MPSPMVAYGARTQGGSIKGKVVADIPDQRKAIDGVVVKLAGDPGANKQFQPLTDVSDNDGEYSFAGLIAGDYVLSVEFQGFKKYEQRSLSRSTRRSNRTYFCSLCH